MPKSQRREEFAFRVTAMSALLTARARIMSAFDESSRQLAAMEPTEDEIRWVRLTQGNFANEIIAAMRGHPKGG